jgi:hypothetical protein
MKRPTEDHLLAKDINILDRLVWIEHDSHWWPAIIYKSYSEVQQHLYRYLDTILKAQFAMAIMLEMNSSKPSKVARILGKSSVELVGVDAASYHELYWNLAAMIRQGCDLSRYVDNFDRYLEFHQALDEIVEIFTIYSQKKDFILVLPDSGYRTWYESAVARLEEWTDDPDQGSFEARDVSLIPERGLNGSTDDVLGREKRSCLKKKQRFPSSPIANNGRPPRMIIRDANAECVDYDTTNYNHQIRDAINAVSTPRAEYSKSNLKLGRRQPISLVQSHPRDEKKGSKLSSKAKVVWE